MKKILSIILVFGVIAVTLLVLPEKTAVAAGSNFMMSDLAAFNHELVNGVNYEEGGTRELQYSYFGNSNYPEIRSGIEKHSRIIADGNGVYYITLDNIVLWNYYGSTFYDYCILVKSGSTLHINIIGDNYLFGGDDKPAIIVENGASLTISGSGNMYCLGGLNGAAGIGNVSGEKAGHITVSLNENGKLYSIGQGDGAGIGSGDSGSISGISIQGSGSVYAFGGKELFTGLNYLKPGTGAGIGTGSNGDINAGEYIEISDNVHVEAYGGNGAAGIGTGNDGDFAGGLSIEDNAYIYSKGCLGGAGIGSGIYGKMPQGGIVIDGSSSCEVEAYGSSGGAGIGTGQEAPTIADTSSLISILGGNVYTEGGTAPSWGGPGIGYGYGGGQPNCYITFANSNVTAIGGNGAAGIGGGTDVMAPQGPTAGIKGAITIKSGRVYAKGNGGGAGIGGGVFNMGGFVEIWSGTVFASGGSVDIGGGNSYARGVLYLDHSTYTLGEIPPIVFLKNGNYSASIAMGETSLQNNTVIAAHTNSTENTIFGVPMPGNLDADDDAPSKAFAQLYTVSFNTNGGSSVPLIQIAKGGSIAASPQTTKENSKFLGWFTDDETFNDQVTFPYTPTETMQLYAKWGDILVTDITISSSEEKLILDDDITSNDTVDLDATIIPNDATNTNVTWTSDHDTIATVNTDGIVTAQSAGTATITVTAEDTTNGTHTKTCIVTVEQAVTNLALSTNAEILNPGQSLQLSATVTPDDATYPTILWTSSNTSVATVDYTGNVTAVANGVAVIDATAGIMQTSFGKSAQCTVTVETLVSGVSLNSSSQVIEKGETYQLVATISPDDATNQTVIWESNNHAVATVSQEGVVTAEGEGDAVITVIADGQSATCDIEVKISVQSISISETSLTIKKGESYTLSATVNPSDATYPTVVWESIDPSIVTVDQTGLVTAVGSGQAIIKVSADGKSAQCTVTTNIPVSGISISSYSETVNRGSSFTLTATVSPQNADNKSVSWTSSDSSVASVDQNGKVTAVGKGKATITATAEGKSASCSVNVVVKVNSINLSKSSITLNKGSSYSLSAVVSPSDASYGSVVWKSSNNAVATVSQSGEVTAVGKGSATITASAGSKSASCDVTVEVAVLSVSISRTSLVLKLGETTQLSAVVNPGDASNQNISWTSSNNAVVRVPDSGLVEAMGIGEASITATIDGKTASCSVVVKQESTVSNSTTPEITPTPAPDITPLDNEKAIDGKEVTSTAKITGVDSQSGTVTIQMDVSGFPEGTNSIRLPNGETYSLSESENGKLSITVDENDIGDDGQLELLLIDNSEVALGSVTTKVVDEKKQKSIWILIIAGLVGIALIIGSVALNLRYKSVKDKRSKRKR